jgi:hypothetical protein
MKIAHYILLIVVVSQMMRCNSRHEKPTFNEIVIDGQAPEHLWMKTTGDINLDGKTDILVGGWQSGGLIAYMAPDWKKEIINDSVKISTNAEVCDVDNNVNPDVVAVINQAIVWFSGPEWQMHHIDSVVGHDVEVHDFDGDGLLDIAARNQGAFGDTGGHTLYFYNQKPLGKWTRYQREIADGEGLKMADINEDKKQDIVTNSYWFENTGDMADWKEHKFTDSWTWPNTFIDVADINGDGRLDILHSPAELAKNFYRISWFEAPKDRVTLWKEHIVADSVETIVHSIGTGDFDGDGRVDIVYAEMQQGTDPDEVVILYNEGDDRWERQVISTGGSHSMRVADLDGDGDMDIFGANFAERIVKMWVNQRER